MQEPISDDELDRLFDIVSTRKRIGIAVSGGPDSTALLLLAHRWASRRAHSPYLHILTVDHGLRAASSGECRAVIDLASRLQRPGSTLVWQHEGPLPVSDIQALARRARYELLSNSAQELSLDAVLLAHTLDDQAETFLMRLQRGSGVTGLAGMASHRQIGSVDFVRPLLETPKSRLIATLGAAGIGYANDPSNAADRFLRVRIRKIMPALHDVGLTDRRLADTARRLARADRALEQMTAQAEQDLVTDHGGVVSLPTARLAELPEEIGLRLISRLIRSIRPTEYPVRAAPLEDWLNSLHRGKPRRRTMSGVVVDPRTDHIWIYAEAGREGFPTMTVVQPGIYVWDGRFEISVTQTLPDATTLSGASGMLRRPELPKAAAGSLPALSCNGLPLEPAFLRHVSVSRLKGFDLLG